MDIKHWLTFLAGLLFLQAPPSAEACQCVPGHLQQEFCKPAAALLKVKFIKASQPGPITSNNNVNINSGYEIQTLQVLKGNETLQNLTFIRSMAGSSCEYRYPDDCFNIEYLIAGSSSENDVSINFCSFKAPWSELSPMQLKGIQGAYQRGCTCGIIYCFLQGCSPTSDHCLIEMFDGNDSQNQHENEICTRNTKGICSWEKMQ